MPKIIFFFLTLFAALLLLPAPAAAQAQNCCLREHSIKPPRFNEWTVPGNGCRVQPPNENCAEGFISEGRCAGIGGCTGEWIRERQVLCSEFPAYCRSTLIQTLANCPNLSAGDCENANNRASCFAYNNRCYSRVDGNVCPQITNPTDCAKSTRCKWQDNRCLSLLEAGLSGQYTPTKGSLLDDPCIVRGTCRDVNDLLRLGLNYARNLFSLLGVIGFVMFVYGGLTMVLSFGSPEKFKQGQMALVAAIIGIAIALSAYLLVNFILSSLGATAEFRAL